MAALTTHPKNTMFGDVAQAADAGGDDYAADPLVTLWVQNQKPIGNVVVTIKEQQRCNHDHHPLVDKTVTIQPGVTWAIEAQDVRFMADGGRRVQVEYDDVTDVYVAAFMGY